jgi:hypothetical protein
MTILRKLWPWSEIARLEGELLEAASANNHWHRLYVKSRATADLLRSELAHLHANTQPRDPKTGRLVRKGEA